MIPALDPREIAFRQFWSNYPRRIAIAEARVAFAGALKIARAEDIISGAHRFATDPNRDETYTVYPAKWLNGQRWADGPLPPRKLSPEELVEKAAIEAVRRSDLERERSAAIGRELDEMKRRAVPMPEDLRQVIREARNAHQITK